MLTWHFFVAALAFTARLRHSSRLQRQKTATAGWPDTEQAELLGKMLFSALTFPLVHFVTYSLHLLDETSKLAREGFIVLWLVLIGTVTLIQSRVMARRAIRLQEEKTALSSEVDWHKKLEQERLQLISELEAKNTEVEARNAEIERYAYVISHDLRTPLVTIGGFLGLLREDAESGNRDRLRSDIDHIVDAAGALNGSSTSSSTSVKSAVRPSWGRSP